MEYCIYINHYDNSDQLPRNHLDFLQVFTYRYNQLIEAQDNID